MLQIIKGVALLSVSRYSKLQIILIPCPILVARITCHAGFLLLLKNTALLVGELLMLNISLSVY